ncbi:hypothetical protein NC652_016908 [Populus alba x Populus x berolinensis]|nr:hypothetical protein NC652_016908 [Populus alba x Populus x berolinensis]
MDRKAKLVAIELSDETSDLQPPASTGQGSKPKKTKSKMKLKEIAVVNENHPIDDGQNINSKEADVPVNIDQEISQSTATSSPVNKETSTKVADFKVEPLVNQKKQLENKADSSPVTVQDQLDEAQGLLKAAVSSAQSKEARLARHGTVSTR